MFLYKYLAKFFSVHLDNVHLLYCFPKVTSKAGNNVQNDVFLLHYHGNLVVSLNYNL